MKIGSRTKMLHAENRSRGGEHPSPVLIGLIKAKHSQMEDTQYKIIEVQSLEENFELLGEKP